MNLLILGASARAAAGSARRIGLHPTCLDLFGDADLPCSSPPIRVDPSDYPDGLARLAEALPPMPWLYTGAIENRPDLVDRVSARHRLLGNDGATLRAVRDPLALGLAARDAGVEFPNVRLDPAGLPVDGSWLRKPLASGGGRGIRPWRGVGVERRGECYFQERATGLPLSVLFVGQGSTALCLGITRQFVGKGGNRFAYRGSLAPWPVDRDTLARVVRLGDALATRHGLRGLFGVDLVLGQGHAWPIEVNPRYTASVEVLEWALGRSLLAEHLGAWGMSVDGPSHPPSPAPFMAKAILFASQPTVWQSGDPWFGDDPWAFPEIADVPHPGTRFHPGEPILSVFAGGDSPRACRKALGTRLVAWRGKLRSMRA